MVAHSRTAIRTDRLRPLNRPRPIRVETAEREDGHPLPARVEYGNIWKPVETILETWQIDDEWWRDRVARSYVDLVVRGGLRLVLYRDRLTGCWYVQHG